MVKYLRFLVGMGLVVLVFFIGVFVGKDPAEPQVKPNPPERTLDKYTIENLSNTNIEPGEFELGDLIDESDEFKTYEFRFKFSPSLDNQTKTTTGMINIPQKGDKFPVILQLRGYVDQEIYRTGMGTKRSSEYYTSNGFVTIAPDFLGYAGSDEEAHDPMEARFQTYVTAVSLLKTIQEDKLKLDFEWDGEVFLWGHSNGGQIALTVLEIAGDAIPTSLWAPVSRPFPYSILYYTDESIDRGKYLRSEIAKFEVLYDTDLYSLDLYLDKINAPIQIHQGTLDDAVPVNWSNDLVNKLENLEKDVTYYTYPADHNLRPAWGNVVVKDIEFFKKHIK